jgi:hypothetical protein
MQGMDALAIFNSLEAVFWMTVGVFVWRKSRFSPSHRRLGWIAANWFVLFGISDVFEVYTGAWWRPLPLLIFKGICVIVLITCGIVYRRTNEP